MSYKNVLFFIASLFLFSCGIEESFYLPQVPQNSVIRISYTEARINLPSIDNYYYALNYSIFYKIYISNSDPGGDIQTSAERSSINSDLSRDYDLINPSTDPISTTTSNGYNILKNRNYFELELTGADIKNVLPKTGGTLNIIFPTAIGGNPTMSLQNGGSGNLRRSSELISPEPKDLYFQNSFDLSSPENANSNKNADVASQNGVTEHAYASMYIIAVGLNPSGFTPIYSKPAHISIFKLPNSNS